MAAWLAPVLSLVGSVFSSIFQTKAAKMEAVATGIAKSLDALKSVNATDAEIATAISTVVAAEAQSESMITRSWRALVMLLITGMIGAWMFGYVPPNINGEMPDIMNRLFDLLTYGICGYIPARSVEKIVRMIMTPRLVNTIMGALGGK